MLIFDKQKQIFIEINGTPGIGSSTFLEEIGSLLRKEQKQFISSSNTEKGNAKKRVLKNIIPLLKTVYIVCLLKPKSIKHFFKYVKRIGSYQMFINEEKHNEIIQLYDEGIFKISTAISERSYKNSMDFLKTCFKYIRKPNILIILDAKPEIIFKRRQKRKRGTFDGISYDEFLERYKEQKDFDNKVIDIFNKEIKIIALNNNTQESISENAYKVVKVLKDLE